eukprot:CAMPEP_0201275770 /NCGR_PEP_ID=MMETSP0853-20130426/53760_1 /ASSEMBLY_ACC=CAM_ASM_000640 /TAXON_ID=183588 /ORGANISM="Pseudo-nitzschia fraudulenta, Strain WWA7" /LENGTH=139 /DNA_ID=CAMNT_0047583505 /DNA_START=431 /DNA_END=850 /DNA_ORIENTATION=+
MAWDVKSTTDNQNASIFIHLGSDHPFHELDKEHDVKDGPHQKERQPKCVVGGHTPHNIDDRVAQTDEAEIQVVGWLVVGHVVLGGDHEAFGLQPIGDRRPRHPEGMGRPVRELAEVGHHELHPADDHGHPRGILYVQQD